MKEPRFSGYYATGLVQYHQEGRHFRYVRVDFNRATVVGNNPSCKNKLTTPKEELMNAHGWRNYLYCYTIGSKNTHDSTYEGPRPLELLPEHYSEGLKGGSSGWRCMQWNVQAMTQEKRTQKKRVISDIAPLVALIN